MLDTLRNFAEVGVAVAGFSAIAVALNRDLASTPDSSERGGLHTLLETAGLVVLFALVPQVLEQAPVSEAALWRSALLGYGLVHLGHAMIIGVRNGARRATVPFAPALFAGGLVVLASQLLVGAFGSLDWVRFVYLVALGWHTLIAAISFAGLILSDRRGGDRAG